MGDGKIKHISVVISGDTESRHEKNVRNFLAWQY